MSERNLDTISDVYKDAYGYRPSERTSKRIDAMSDGEYEGFLVTLKEDLGSPVDADHTYEVQSIAVFSKRLVGMMIDYKIPMSTALIWDFESFGRSIKDLYEIGGDDYVEHDFDFYLAQNGIDSFENAEFYMDIFTGRGEDLSVKKM